MHFGNAYPSVICLFIVLDAKWFFTNDCLIDMIDLFTLNMTCGYVYY